MFTFDTEFNINVVLSVQLRIIRAALLSQCQKGEVVHESLEHITGIPCFPRLPDVGDFLGCDATLEIAVANLKSTEPLGKAMAKYRLPLWVKRASLHSLFASSVFIPLSADRRIRRGKKAALLPTAGNLVVIMSARQKRRRRGARACLPCYHFQKVGHMVGCVEFRRQCDDVAAFPGGKSYQRLRSVFTLNRPRFPPSTVTCTIGCRPAVLRVSTPDCAGIRLC